MIVYLDESGDLGWNFSKPYREGGSSQYLTIAFLITPPNKAKFPKRIMRSMYKLRNPPPKELKGKNLTYDERLIFVNKTIGMLNRHPEIQLLAITVRKQNVQQHIRQDPNKLYNFMINLSLLERIENEPVVTFIPDPRTIKVESGNSLIDYLQINFCSKGMP